jgi:ribosomal protein L37E
VRQTERPLETIFGFTIEIAMISLNDILSALKLWPKWKRIEATVEQVDALEKRVAQLEKLLARCPGEGCPRCGELTFRATASYPHPSFANMGVNVRKMKCEKCGFEEDHMITLPKAR